uniref:NHR domain-containing protein n=1 Tax=Angiostrongylus cantonensis TaxID=6313 RepID=A0A0K0D659_ANGCA
FTDPSDFHVPRSSSTAPCTTTASSPRHEPASVEPPVTLHRELQVASTSSSSGFECLRFHQVTGRHISLNAMRNIATRCDSEYSQGYVFSERPIRNNEKVVIEVITVQKLYIGGLAFGVTCCDPSTLRPADLPDNSSDLVEMPQYWVGIKDIALQPPVNTVLSFWITDAGTFNVKIVELLHYCHLMLNKVETSQAPKVNYVLELDFYPAIVCARLSSPQDSPPLWIRGRFAIMRLVWYQDGGGS